MNSTVILALTIGFAMLAFLLLCLIVYSPLQRRVKLLVVALTTVFYFVGYQALQDTQGWASADDMPARFVLLAAVIEEPVKDKSKGEIFVWVQPILENKPAGEPRAFRFPYEKGLHSLFESAMKKARNGNSQMGTLKPRKGPKTSSVFSKPGGNLADRIKIMDLPKAQLPEK